MKEYRLIIILIVLVVSSAPDSVLAQRQAKTSSAKAAYGKSEPVKFKANKKYKKQPRNKVVKVAKPKVSREKGVANRRNRGWAG